MKKETLAIYEDLFVRYPDLVSLKDEIMKAYLTLEECFKNEHVLFTCGNGGSASDADHIVGELMKNFKKIRRLDDDIVKRVTDLDLLRALERGYPAISLVNQDAFSTAYANDHEAVYTFAQQIHVLGHEGDVLIAISTGGNSKNCVMAAQIAQAKDMKVIAFTGKTGGELKKHADVSIIIKEEETYLIQERHLPIYHCLCAMIEEEIE